MTRPAGKQFSRIFLAGLAIALALPQLPAYSASGCRSAVASALETGPSSVAARDFYRDDPASVAALDALLEEATSTSDVAIRDAVGNFIALTDSGQMTGFTLDPVRLSKALHAFPVDQRSTLAQALAAAVQLRDASLTGANPLSNELALQAALKSAPLPSASRTQLVVRPPRPAPGFLFGSSDARIIGDLEGPVQTQSATEVALGDLYPNSIYAIPARLDGPAGYLGPLGSRGPMGHGLESPDPQVAGVMNSLGDLSAFANLLTQLGGPLSEAGPLGYYGPIGLAAQVFPRFFRVANAGGAFGPWGVFGPLGRLGPLGRNGGHLFARDAESGRYFKDLGGGRREYHDTVSVGYYSASDTRTYPLHREIPEGYASRNVNPTSWSTDLNRPLQAGEVRTYAVEPSENEFLSALVIPHAKGDRLLVELFDAATGRTVRSDSVTSANNLHVSVKKGAKLQLRIRSLGTGATQDGFTLSSVGSTSYALKYLPDSAH